MNDRDYLTKDEFQKIKNLVEKFPFLTKKEANEKHYKSLEFACNSLRSRLGGGGARNILGELPAVALHAAGNGDINFLETKMYVLEGFVREEQEDGERLN